MGKGRRTAWGMGAATAGVLAVALAGCGGGQSGDGGGGSGGPGGNLSQRPPPAFPIFDGTRLHEVSLEMSPDDWQSILNDTRGDEYRHATLTYDGVKLEDVGVRPSGESSRFPGNQKMSTRIKFDAFDGRGHFGGYRDINVKGEYDDYSMMRERLALYYFAAFMPATQTAHARLIVNGELRGLFTLREDWDDTSIAEHFPQPVGPLYRIRPPDHTVDSYVYLGADPALYVPSPWEPQIKMPARGDEVIAPMLQAIADPFALETVVDVDALINYIAVSAIVMTTDGLVGSSGASDHFQYFDPQSGKFFVLPWDPDNTFGSSGETPEKLIYSKLGRNTLTIAVRDRDDLRARYKARIAEMMAALPVATVQAQVDTMYALIRDAALADPNKIFDNGSFEWAVGDIKTFAAARYANLQGQLAQ